MNRILLILILSVWTMSGYSQKYMQEGKKKYLIDWKIEILGDSSECFNPEIPFNIRLNTKDTVSYIAEKTYRFYKGKCDTIHFLDTTELYFDCLFLYKIKEYEELQSIADLSKALNNMQESNYSAFENDSMQTYRIAYFSVHYPIVINFATENNVRIVTKRVFGGSFIDPQKEISKSKDLISNYKWKKLTTLIRQISIYKPEKPFEVLYPDLVVESYENGIHNYLYLERNELNLPTRIQRQMNKIEKLIENKY